MAEELFDAELDVTLSDVSIKIGGQKRLLSYDMAAISRVDRMTGINLFDAVLTAPGAEATAALLYAGLLPRNPELKFEEVLPWVSPRNRFVILKAVREAWLGSIPDETDGVGDPVEGEVDTQAQP